LRGWALGKNIVFCADGTWGGPGAADTESGVTTNVYKLFTNLAGRDTPDSLLLAREQKRIARGPDGSAGQVAKYLHGVGDGDNYLVKLLAGIDGAGLIARIVRGYTFLSRHYAPGDRIYLAGFSRGAYAVRALAGMICAQGLLDSAKSDLGDKEAAYRLGAAAWYGYRRAVLAAEDGNSSILQSLADLAELLPGCFTRPVAADRLIAAPIEAVAAWETVGSYGIPDYAKSGMRLDLFRFADTALGAGVKHARHAVAVDERRADFTPTLWDADPRIKQALFPGSHGDVGGGYAGTGDACGLSDLALEWMSAELASLGVLFGAEAGYEPHPDCAGVLHEQWLEPPWDLLPRAARVFPAGLCLGRSVIGRVNAGAVEAVPEPAPLPYAPENLGGYLVRNQAAPGIAVV
jgi:uncharacterized protein (DUF2235 family)